MELKFEPKITKQFLLDKASQETYLEYYLGIPVKKGLFKSPLREDNNPTCAFYKNASGDIIFKDFSGNFYGNFISVVMFKYGVSYYKALRIIANDFDYISIPSLKKCEKPITASTTEFKDAGEANIQIEMQDYEGTALKYWSDYGITEKILKKFKVYSCRTVFLNGNFFCNSSPSRPIFGYYRGKNENETELWRIYMPFHRAKEPKFLSNWKSIMLQGAKQLPKEGELLVVTKSLKDVMVLYSLGITAIAPNSENLFMTENQFSKLSSRFKHIVLFYDNDLPGIHNMNKIRKEFNVQCLWIPRKYHAKDISDFYKMYGREETLKLIEYGKTKAGVN